MTAGEMEQEFVKWHTAPQLKRLLIYITAEIFKICIRVIAERHAACFMKNSEARYTKLFNLFS